MRPTHYVLRSAIPYGAVFVKEAEFFEAQGGLTDPWGRRWWPVIADSVDQARIIVERWLSAHSHHKWPREAREEAPLSGEPKVDLHTTADATVWAKEYLRIINSPGFEVPNLWDEGFLIAWFANAIETGKAFGRRESEAAEKQTTHKETIRDQVKNLELQKKLRRAVTLYDAMSPEEKKAHDEAQRESWVRGNSSESRRSGGLVEADYSKLEERIIGHYVDRGTVSGRLKASDSEPQRIVPKGQIPLDENLKHPLLDVIEEGKKARDEGAGSPYDGHTLEHCLHATGWVYRDLQLAFERLRVRLAKLEVEVSDDE